MVDGPLVGFTNTVARAEGLEDAKTKLPVAVAVVLLSMLACVCAVEVRLAGNRSPVSGPKTDRELVALATVVGAACVRAAVVSVIDVIIVSDASAVVVARAVVANAVVTVAGTDAGMAVTATVVMAMAVVVVAVTVVVVEVAVEDVVVAVTVVVAEVAVEDMVVAVIVVVVVVVVVVVAVVGVVMVVVVAVTVVVAVIDVCVLVVVRQVPAGSVLYNPNPARQLSPAARSPGKAVAECSLHQAVGCAAEEGRWPNASQCAVDRHCRAHSSSDTTLKFPRMSSVNSQVPAIGLSKA